MNQPKITVYSCWLLTVCLLVFVSVPAQAGNTGNRDGEEVMQLYIKHKGVSVPVPIHALKGFKCIALKKGE